MSGCPFFSGSKPIKEPFSIIQPVATDPLPFPLPREFSEPYVSPYNELFLKFRLKRNNPLKPLSFLYRNSLFHHTYITKYRAQDFLAKVAIANELRESGNKSFNQNLYEKAAICYEHAYCLFKYAEFTEDDNVNIVTTEVEESDINARNGIVAQILINYSYTLIKLRHYTEAQEILTEAKSFSYSKDVKATEVACKLADADTTFEDLASFAGFVSSLAKDNRRYIDLRINFEQVVYKIQQNNCEFFARFFEEFKVNTTIKSTSEFELEFNVIWTLNLKYLKMLEYYKNTETYSKVLKESREVQRVFAEMKKVKKITPMDTDDIMLSHAKAAGVDLSLPISRLRFESAKRSCLSKVFNTGSFNRKLLYECIQEVMNEYEKVAEVQDKVELEYVYWKRGLIGCIILAVIVYLTTTPNY